MRCFSMHIYVYIHILAHTSIHTPVCIHLGIYTGRTSRYVHTLKQSMLERYSVCVNQTHIFKRYMCVVCVCLYLSLYIYIHKKYTCIHIIPVHISIFRYTQLRLLCYLLRALNPKRLGLKTLGGLRTLLCSMKPYTAEALLT